MGGRKGSAPFYLAHQSMETRENAVRATVMQAFKRWLCQNLLEEIGEVKEEKSIFTLFKHPIPFAFGQRMKKGKCLEATAM